MPWHHWNIFRPDHRGVRFALYGHNKKKDRFGASFFGSSHNPDPAENITMKDIDEELSKLRIVDDRIRTRIFGKKKVGHLTDEKEKISMLSFHGMPFSQGFNGEFDYMNSRIKNRYRKFIPKEEYIEIKKKNKNVECFAERKDNNGRKYVLVEYGDIARV